MSDPGRHDPARPVGVETVARLVFWYLALLLPTVFFKMSYLHVVAGDRLAIALASGSLGHLPAFARFLAIIGSDLWEVLVIVAVAWIVTRIVGLDIAWMVGVTIFVALIVSALNWVSFETAGVLATRDNIDLAVAWVRENPAFLTAQRIDLLVAAAVLLLVAFAGLWSIASFLLVRYAVTPRTALPLIRVAGSFLIALGVSVVFARVAAAHEKSGAQPESFRGYWSETARSLLGSESWRPLAMHAPSVGRVDSEYTALVYPTTPASRPRIPIAPNRIRPAHVVVVGLETAARKYYNIIDNPAYPTFFEMGHHGLVSDHHYATMPATTWAIYSIVSGTYPREGRAPVDYGDFLTDGLASMLGRQGYETTFIDSYHIDWNPANGGHFNSLMLRGLGFEHLAEPSPSTDASYAAAVGRERRSLARAVDAIATAQSHKTKAFVYIATLLGHYPWRSPPGAEGQSSQAKLAGIALALDSCFSEFLRTLHDRGLDSSLIIVATGDHGLRTRFEFASLGEQMSVGNAAFNVPLILYAPQVFDSEIHIPYVTSHVDLAPTLLDLVGARSGSVIEEGSSILNGGPCGRITFLLNNTLRPVDGFYYAGRMFVWNRLTGDVSVSPASPDPCTTAAADPDVPTVLSHAGALFDTTTAIFLQRRRK